MQRILIADCETTGLPVSYDAPFQDVNNWPRITQLAWELCWSNGDTIKKSCELVIPDGWKFPTSDFHIANGFNEANNLMLGKPMAELLYDLAIAMNTADVMVCHNLQYDKPIIECEMFRYNVLPLAVAREHPFGLREEGVKLRKECTKLMSTPILKIPGYRGDYKWPTLAEAYQYMYGESFDKGHHAGNDVEATKQIYLWMKDMEGML